MTGISYIKAFGRLFYPVTCGGCGQPLVDNEQHICTLCQISLPQTQFHSLKENPLENLFKLRMRVDFISSFLFYDKGLKTQHILHEIKYNGNKHLATYLGELYGYDLKTTMNPLPDYIIPVPLHKRKQKERGYNQSEFWGLGLSKSLGIPMLNQHLIRTQYANSQTKKSRTDRIKNVQTAFKTMRPEDLKRKNILLVDDVITTGATLEACGHMLWQADIKSLQIATIAYAVK